MEFIEQGGEVMKMLRKIYKELVEIRKELQAIWSSRESRDDYVMVREPYSTRYTLVKVGRDRSLEAE